MEVRGTRCGGLRRHEEGADIASISILQGALFLGDGRDTAEGWPIKSLTIPDAVYILMGEDGTPNDNGT